MADVARVVLPDAERNGGALSPSCACEANGDGVGAKDPDKVQSLELVQKRAPRAAIGAELTSYRRDSGVVRKLHEPHVLAWQCVVAALWLGFDPPEQDDLVDVFGRQTRHEPDKRLVRREALLVAPVEKV